MTTTSKTRPTILIIHGAWHTPEFYELFRESLEAQGYKTVCPHLPTCQSDLVPRKKLSDDIALIRETAQFLIDNDEAVIAVMHSYGGVVGTDALYGLPIQELIYLTAFAPLSGESLAGIFEGHLPPFITVDDESDSLTIPDPISWFFNDLPIQTAAVWGKKLAVHPKSAQFDPIKNEAYRTASTTYIVCDEDVALTPTIQEYMIDRLLLRGLNVRIESLPASHSPFLSIPKETAELVLRIAS